jgi:murein DD-endopeptidase MepM/ murein hydrolase activator NlpD
MTPFHPRAILLSASAAVLAFAASAPAVAGPADPAPSEAPRAQPLSGPQYPVRVQDGDPARTMGSVPSAGTVETRPLPPPEAASPAPLPEPQPAPYVAPPPRTEVRTVKSITGPVVAVEGKPISYRVKSGQGLDAVAREMGTTRKQLAADNDLKEPFLIKPGQTLKGPVSKAKAYVVQGGDTLFAIAKRFGVSAAAIADENGFELSDAIRSGQKLRLPTGFKDSGPIKKTVTVTLDPLPPPVVRTPPRPVTPPPQVVTPVPAPVPTTSQLPEEPTIGAPPRVTPPPAAAPVVAPVTTSPPVRTPTVRPPPATVPATPPAARPPVAMSPPATTPVVRPPVDRPPVTPTAPVVPPSTSPVRPPAVSPTAPRPTATAPPPRTPTSPPISTPSGSAPLQADRPPVYTEADYVRMAGGRFDWPVRGTVLSSYGPKGGGQRNDGVDIGATAGTSVRASAEGTVVYSGGDVPGFGVTVLIQHADGWVTVYGHLQRADVKMQQRVSKGQQIGLVGASGEAPRPQLHFEIRHSPSARFKARAIDPTLVLPR